MNKPRAFSYSVERKQYRELQGSSSYAPKFLTTAYNSFLSKTTAEKVRETPEPLGMDFVELS